MSKFYHVYVEADHKWIGAPNNGGECCISPEDTVEELNRLLAERDAANARIKRLEEAVAAYQSAYAPDGHVAPHDCFATGPRTGEMFQDLVACPGCWAERKAKESKP